MDWLLGISKQGRHTKFVMCSSDAQIDSVQAVALAKHGLPQAQKTSRQVFTGELRAWRRTTSDVYCRAMNIEVPPGETCGHSIFVYQVDAKTCIHVPALALMRGLFKPHKLLLPALFTPCSIDLLGFVDFRTQPPLVVLDSQLSRYAKRADGESIGEPLRWAHSSHSGRRCVQSVYAAATKGYVDLGLPKGIFRLVMHGVRKDTNLFVTKLTVISIEIEASDSIAGQAQSFTFHRMASSERTVTALKNFPAIAQRSDGHVSLTDAEWKRVQGLLNKKWASSTRYCRRLLLDLMLEKLASKCSWDVMAKRSLVPKVSLTTTFRRWDLEGRFLKVLEVLNQMRQVRVDAPDAELVESNALESVDRASCC